MVSVQEMNLHLCCYFSCSKTHVIRVRKVTKDRPAKKIAYSHIKNEKREQNSKKLLD